MQKCSEDQNFHPVQFLSRKTSQTEENYSSYELEVLAVITALKKWRIYLKGVKFTIITDCNAFALTMRKEDVPPRVARWALFLQEFDYQIVHRSGSQMRHVDALSRMYCLQMEETLRHRLLQAQLNDDWTKAVRTILEKGHFEDFYISHGILCKDPSKELVVVPCSMEEDIIRTVHRQNHFAARKTQELVEKSYYIPQLGQKIVRIVASCIECIVANAKMGKKEGFLTPIPKDDQPLGTYHLDHLGPLTATAKRYNHILSVVDAFSKFVWLYPTKDTGALAVIDRLGKQAAIFGNPRRIITDRGAAFTSQVFKNYCSEQGIQHRCAEGKRTGGAHPPNGNPNIDETVFEQSRSMV
uniref:RNA-directed DNA polymerase n=1 Tax=Zeugodacus cucurbitae TaxID=28588 RepID=A0A0A1WLR9_ZEUCU